MSPLLLLASNLAIASILFAGLWVMAQIHRDPSFVDSFWAFGILIMAVSSFVLADGWEARQLLITALAVMWGLRLGLHLFIRWRHEGPDRRYAALLSGSMDKRGWSYRRTTALFIFAPQAVLLWVTSLPVQLAQTASEPAAFGLLAGIGLALALFGFVFEAVADAQLARFKSDPDNAGKVMDRGLWAWSRHPNYFGEACFWWGVWLIGAETLPGLFAIAGPLFLTFTLTRWSGAPLLEKGLDQRRPGYADYIQRTPSFIPRPPQAQND